MKSIVGLLLLALSLNISAADIKSSMEGTRESFCPDYTIGKTDDTAYCKVANAKEVIQAKIGAELTEKETNTLRAAGIHIYGPMDIGLVPDADSGLAFYYDRWLVNSAGKKVGIIGINGWYNNEMRDSARFYIRYNLQGKAVMISIENGLRD